jgi:putative nucleotidyltransferase with HDIG domain
MAVPGPRTGALVRRFVAVRATDTGGTAVTVRNDTARTRLDQPASPRDVAASLPRPRPRGGTAPTPVVDRSEHRWVPRPIIARCTQLVVLTVPVAAAVTCAALVSATLPRAHDLGAALAWWAVVVVSSTTAMWLVDRAARRLLPLAWLLRLSLLFPDKAPKRFRLAARTWNSHRLREQVEAAKSGEQTGTPVEAATQIITLLSSLAIHDRRTRGHCERVRAYNDLLAEELGLGEADRDRLRWAALIHDIGKLKVPPRLLNKPGKPSPSEWSVLRAHPLRGAEIAAPLAPWLGLWAAAIEEHHERWDGDGYPHGRAGNDISLGARIVAVADAFEVMTSPRPYSRAVDPGVARAELARCAGSHFDPMVVRAFLNISLGRLRRAMGPIAWFTQVPFLAGMPRLEAAILNGGRNAATGAGAVAGVVAVTTLAPVGPHHGHAHTHPVIAVVDGVKHAKPGPAVAPTPVAPAHHRGARDVQRHAAKPARHHAPASAAQAGAGGRPARQHDRSDSNPGQHSVAPLPADHGRCAGNSGHGLGNGGPLPPAQRDLGDLPTSAREHGLGQAPGLHACD